MEQKKRVELANRHRKDKKMEIERKRLKFMRETEGNHYIFFDNTINATYTLNTISYLPISRQDAKFILGMIRQSQEQTSLYSDLEFEKVTAKHNNNYQKQNNNRAKRSTKKQNH